MRKNRGFCNTPLYPTRRARFSAIDAAAVHAREHMAEETIIESTADKSGAGKTPDFSVTVETPKGGDKAGNETGDAGKGSAEKHDDPEYTKAFKQRLDRMRASEQRRFEAELKKREDAWEKKFKELEGRIGGSGQPKPLKREDFGSDEEFQKAKRDSPA